jgi:hypothetical protein
MVMMMKITLLLFISFHLNENRLALPGLRQQLGRAANNKAEAEKFYDRFKTVKEDAAPIMVGFRALSELILCKHVFSPVSKLSHFKKGKRLLELAISREPKNAELIFFRFTTQSNVPSLLNYSDNLNPDRLLLISYLENSSSKAADPDLFKRIRSYLLSSKLCTEQEIKRIRRL